MKYTLIIAALFVACKTPDIQRAGVLQPGEDSGSIFYDMYYIKKHKVFLKIDNDDKEVVISLAVNDNLSQAKIDMMGSTLWIDTRGGNKKEMGIAYPLSINGPTQYTVGSTEDMAFRAIKFDGIPKEEILYNDNSYGIKVNTGYHEKYKRYIYSYSIPLSVMHVSASSVLGILYETNTRLLNSQQSEMKIRTGNAEVQASSQANMLTKKKKASMVDITPGVENNISESSSTSNMGNTGSISRNNTLEKGGMPETEMYGYYKFKVLVQLNNEFMDIR